MYVCGNCYRYVYDVGLYSKDARPTGSGQVPYPRIEALRKGGVSSLRLPSRRIS